MGQALAAKRFDKVSSNLPTKINGTFDLPKLHELIIATGEKNVKGFIEFELVKLAERINVGGNLTDSQVEFIASQLVGMYPTETLADFKLCFEGIAMGRYIKQDKIFKLDGSEIGYAVGQYLEEKYRLAEDLLMKEKDNQYANVKAPIATPVTYKLVYDYPWVFPMVKNAKARRLAWESRWRSMSIKGRPVLPISEKEMREEGKVKPKYRPYPSTPPGYQAKIDATVRKCRELYFRENYPGATEEQVQQYLDSFEK